MDERFQPGRYAGKKILVGITGGISAYKSCEAIRYFVSQGALVRAVMTRAACEFLTPLTVETLTRHPVATELFPSSKSSAHALGTFHIEMAQWPDLLLILPASANIIGKVANGIADDALSTITMACAAPKVFAPAMNDKMYLNPIVQKNIDTLRHHGYMFVDPDYGFLAEGYEGTGRLAESSRIYWQVDKILLGNDTLAGRRVLVTAGPTHEPVDAVRVVTNLSSGKMGFALARQAGLMGAQVTLISGPTNLKPPLHVAFEPVLSAADMKQAVLANYDASDIVIMSAAVADFKPAKPSSQKMKKTGENLSIELEPTTDILAELGQQKGNKILVGFALETENGLENARKKLHSKNLDFVVLNNPTEPGAGFGSDTNIVAIIDRQDTRTLPMMSKDDVARVILDKICATIK